MPADLPNDFESRWRQRFEGFGRQYSTEAQIAGWTSNGLLTRLRAFERHCGPVTGCWLDAGCGAGSYTRLLRHQGAERVYGVDFSVPSLAKARGAGVDDPAVSWLAADVRRLPFCDSRFDGTLCFGVTQALSESTSLVRELVRVTKPGGEVWVDGLNDLCVLDMARHLAGRLTRRGTRLRLESARRLRNVLLEAGCRKVAIVWVPILPAAMAGFQKGIERAGLAWLPVAGPALSHAFLIRARR